MIAMGAEGELAREVGTPGWPRAKGGEGRSNPPERRREAPFCETQGDVKPWLRKRRAKESKARYGREER